MDTSISHLISLNVELEGLLRVLSERDSLHARSALKAKFENYAELLKEFLENPAEPEIAHVTEAADKLAAEATHVEVKDQEAQETEDESSLDAAEDIIAKHEEQERKQPGCKTQLNKAFTLNDRFRFRRELFAGNDADFADTLTLLSDMDSYDEAADYLVNDMMWDKDNAAVRDFLAILAQNMPQ